MITQNARFLHNVTLFTHTSHADVSLPHPFSHANPIHNNHNTPSAANDNQAI